MGARVMLDTVDSRRARHGGQAKVALSRESNLIDPHGRRMRKLRVSLLDACNFRCLYCMPLQSRFMPKSDWLPTTELVRIASQLVMLGIEEIRLTGGEPTLRPDLCDIAAALSPMGPLGSVGLKKLGLTTNGMKLQPLLSKLLHADCRNLNISIDSLNRKRFAEIAHYDGLTAVTDSIRQAAAMGFNVKLNMVVMRGLNDTEIVDFLDFARNAGAEVRFLELMAIGPAAARQPELFVSAAELRQRIAEHTPFTAVPVERDSTARVYQTEAGARFGIIAPVTESFCGSCSRWRLTASGKLKTCLMTESGVDLRDQSDARIAELCAHALHLKPGAGPSRTVQQMNTIGG
jgi:cyclic pyranopterin phosphate synthase